MTRRWWSRSGSRKRRSRASSSSVTWEWDVPLMVTRGFPSLSFTYAAAEAGATRVRCGVSAPGSSISGDAGIRAA